MKKVKLSIYGLSLLASSVILFSCSKSDNATTSTTTTTTNGNTTSTDIAPVVQSKYLSSWVTVSLSSDGNSIVLKSDGRPNSHKSPYWGVGNALYEAFPSGHAANPNTFTSFSYTMTIPRKPVAASNKEATSLGAIGMALNGVAIYNDQEGPNTALDARTIGSFDGAGAHPTPTKEYHYHVTGTYTTIDDANLVGFLRDGFPLYGRKDVDGTYPSLDAYGGHTAATAEFPSGIYHYHTSNTNYLNTGYYVLKSGSYYGTKGTFTQ